MIIEKTNIDITILTKNYLFYWFYVDKPIIEDKKGRKLKSFKLLAKFYKIIEEKELNK